MDKINNFIANNSSIDDELNEYFDECLNDSMFRKVVSSLDIDRSELIKYSSLIMNSACELSNCKSCKNLLECRNEVNGYVYYPEVVDKNIVFNYIPCKYKKKLDRELAYQKNVYTFNIPRELTRASMKDIHIDDKNRVEVIKWIKEFLDDYKKGIKRKGLYLTGNFGCGKTYLLTAMLNELAKLNHRVAIIYYPEFLRSLKASFSSDGDFQDNYNFVKNIELLLIDDIGAETTTSWGRDEILGTILQYRMEEGLTTFFTSNLNINELEDHLSISKNGVEKVKAKRIIERIKQLADIKVMISENKRK